MSRVRCLAIIVLLSLGLTTFLACTDDSSDLLVAPITGVTVQAQSLVAGIGCGTAPAQVFKYLVIVFGPNADDAQDAAIPLANKRYTQFLAANIYDCFSDGTFTNLPAVDGINAYHLEVYAYDEAAYNAANPTQLAQDVKDLQSNLDTQNDDIGNGGDGGLEAPLIQSGVDTLRAIPATYSTLCSAEQLGEVQSLALCAPLSLGSGDAAADAAAPAIIKLPLDGFTTAADAAAISCGTDFATVHVTSTVDGTAGPALADTLCTATPITVLSMSAEPAAYVFAVTLLKADGTTYGSTTCNAQTSPNLTVTALCNPVQ